MRTEKARRTYHLPAMLHKFGDYVVEQLGCNSHESARLGVVRVRFIELQPQDGKGVRKTILMIASSVHPLQLRPTARRLEQHRCWVRERRRRDASGEYITICEYLDAPDAKPIIPRQYYLLEGVTPIRGGLIEVLHAVYTELQSHRRQHMERGWMKRTQSGYRKYRSLCFSWVK